jgi:hypothetical protein
MSHDIELSEELTHLRRSSLVNGGRLQPLQRRARVVVAARAPLIPYLSRMTSKTEENRPESTRN